MHRVIERILNLLAFLLTVGRPVSADEIRHTVAGYDQDTDEAFRRTFERDKDLLRMIGVPLRMDYTDAWEVEQGYVVRPEEYALPDPGLTDEERRALWLASRVARLGGSSGSIGAIYKLGGTPVADSGDALAADLGSDADTLATLFTALGERRKLRFDYRGEKRTVEPLGLVHRMGHWYLIARTKGERRTYRVDRMTAVEPRGESGAFERPKGFRVADAVPDAPWEAGQEAMTATVRFDPDVAWWARRQVGRRASVADDADGGVTVTMPVASSGAFIGWLIGFGASAEVLGPEPLREAFVSHVRGPS